MRQMVHVLEYAIEHVWATRTVTKKTNKKNKNRTTKNKKESIQNVELWYE